MDSARGIFTSTTATNFGNRRNPMALTDQDKIAAHAITGEAFQILAHHPGSAEDLCRSAINALALALLEHSHLTDPTEMIAAEVYRQARVAAAHGCPERSPTQASSAKLLEQVGDAKQRVEALIVDLHTLRLEVGAYTKANGLAHSFHDHRGELDDDQLDEDGREIDTSMVGVADRMVIDGYGVSAQLDLLRAAVTV
jgi:hypothetical protein